MKAILIAFIAILMFIGCKNPTASEMHPLDNIPRSECNNCHEEEIIITLND